MCCASFVFCPLHLCHLWKLNTPPPGASTAPTAPTLSLNFFIFLFLEVSHAAVLHFLLFSLLFPPYFKSCLFAHLFTFCHTFISFWCSY